MPQFDLPLEQLQTYHSNQSAPSDFWAFWQDTLVAARAHPLNASFAPYPAPLQTIDAFDVTFAGYGGQAIKAWLLLPANRSKPLPCVVEYIGYGGGRGFATDNLLWASCGFAWLLMDTRGQGSSWSKGDTPDLAPDGDNPQHPGFMTRGILQRETYYYRRVFTDAVRAIEAAKSHPDVDKTRIGVTGGSQGGGIAIAAAALEPSVKALAPDVPFLCNYSRAMQIVNSDPYGEIVRFLKVHRHLEAEVLATLAYFDGQHFASHSHAKALYSVGLMDEICPPSTVYAAFNNHVGEKEMAVYPYNHHEGGGAHHTQRKMAWMKQVLACD
jgi:cephalosporin-C deacetylase